MNHKAQTGQAAVAFGAVTLSADTVIYSNISGFGTIDVIDFALANARSRNAARAGKTALTKAAEKGNLLLSNGVQ